MNRNYLLVAAALALLPALASSQMLEQPAPFDSGGKIMEWSLKLENQVKLFANINGFQKALLWKADSSYSLEIVTNLGRLRRALLRNRARIAFLTMVPDDPGTWLFHCHVGPHILAGMQALYRVEPR